ncbi:hypothetical protein, partial [Staphylococcus epidermidis]|uniref:hypothetical protein n=1 Tax=Staphylococcus epidermidis TaxID=1282 RepID=UPI00119E5A92
MKEDNGKAVFWGNRIKGNCEIRISGKGGEGKSENRNRSVIEGGGEDSLRMNEIVKEEGENVSNDDINNGVEVGNKNRVGIKEGNALPTN